MSGSNDLKEGTRVRVDIESENVLSGKPARVLVYENEQLVAEVVANIEPQQGADGGHYRSVALRKLEQKSGKARDKKTEHDHSRIIHGRSHFTDRYPDGCLVHP